MNLTLYLTQNCNMRCKYCIREKTSFDMTEEIVRAALDLAFSKGQKAGVCFFGGEPLLKKDLIAKAYEYAHALSEKTGMPFESKITTNGTLMDDEILDMFVKNGTEVGLSFDGLCQDDNRIFTDGKSSFDVLEEKSRKLLSVLPNSYAMTVMAPGSLHKLSDNVRFIHDLGFKKMLVSPAYGKNVSWSDEDLSILKDEMNKVADYLSELFFNDDRFYFSALHAKISECIKGFNPSRRCHLGVRQLAIESTGNIYPCTSFLGDKDFLLGNVFDGLNDLKIREIASRNSLPESCVNCDLKERCTNSCGCANRMNTGNENLVSPLQCAYERMTIEIADDLGNRLYEADSKRFLDRFAR